MKQLAIILSLVIGNVAHADFKVGDTAIYLGATQGQKFDIKYEVAEVNEQIDYVKIVESIIFNGQVVQQQTEETEISTAQQNENMFDACLELPAELNPRFESITVAAGTFNTCHITSKTGTAVTEGFFAKVLFGIVKISKTGSTDNTDMSMELKSIKKL